MVKIPGVLGHTLLLPLLTHPPPATDINECALDPEVCANGMCENLRGSYRCICNLGYEAGASGKDCTGEHGTWRGMCGQPLLLQTPHPSLPPPPRTWMSVPSTASCVTMGGARTALAATAAPAPRASASGRTRRPDLVGAVPADIDECLSSPCVNSICQNVAGSYTCRCAPGSQLGPSGTICLDSTKGTCWLKIQESRCEVNLQGATLRSECCATLGAAWGSPCERCEIGNALLEASLAWPWCLPGHPRVKP
ncbi:hypothetical protein P7K49_033161 [Saguinus oedipus]|uniref:Uncharacterized protein n=1 Tax=Saguinus oedipus TaxID=9490 RepID=A0ABQ9TR53_SAGOE|nr:hypothetical protein P7K49_033161 [Saguinus oedipus]